MYRAHIRPRYQRTTVLIASGIMVLALLTSGAVLAACAPAPHVQSQPVEGQDAEAPLVESVPTDLKWSERMALSEIKRVPDPRLLDFQERPKWEYTNGLVLRAINLVNDRHPDPRYIEYIDAFYDRMVHDDGSIERYDITLWNIDRIAPGRLLFNLYDRTGNEKYLKAAERLRYQLEWQPRNSQGGFWHKLVYPWQMWLDGAFMGPTFYAEYAARYDEPGSFDDAAHQLIVMERNMRDPETGLLYHGWDESRTQRWADPITGLSPHFWGRAIGWYGMALVEILDVMPPSSTHYDDLVGILNRLVVALERFQDDETGLWYQVVDLGHREGNYLEASASAMFVYAIAKGVNDGHLDARYMQIAERGYDGIIGHLVTVDADGEVHLNQVCGVAGLGGSPYRDGSYEYYVNEIIRSNDPKGTGPFIKASLELDR